MRKLTTFKGLDENEYVIKIDANTGQFHTIVNGEGIQSDTLRELLFKARSATISQEQLEWKPYMTIEYNSSRYGQAFRPGIYIWRGYYAISNEISYRCKWGFDKNEDMNINRTTMKDIIKFGFSQPGLETSEWVMEYNEELFDCIDNTLREQMTAMMLQLLNEVISRY